VGSLGPYALERELARGGMGVVYLARDPQGQPVAIKVILGGGEDLELAARFRREAEALTRLDHPGILRVRDHGVEQGRPYMVMDLLQGPTLEQWVKTAGRLPGARVAELGARMAQALSSAHRQGIVHRDLKPANVILEGEQPVLVDFGIVRMLGLDQSRLTETGALLGSPSFMAPEQADGLPDVGPAADVYGLGATLYYLATGRPPFEGGKGMLRLLKDVLTADPTPPRQLAPDLDPALEAVILRCLQKDPAERYPSAFALEQALGAPREAKAPGRLRLDLALAGGLALAGVGSLLAVSLAGRPEPAPSERPVAARSAGDRLVVEHDRLLAEAQRCLAAGDQKGARAAIGRALELVPDSCDALISRARLRMRASDLRVAEIDLERARELYPESPRVYLGLGMSRLGLGDANGAIAMLTRAIELDPEVAEAYGQLAFAMGALGRHAEALEQIDLALLRAPESPLFRCQRALSLALLGRSGAQEELERVGDWGDLDLEAIELAARAYLCLREPQRALEACERALERGPHPKLLALVGDARMSLLDYGGALESYAQSLGLDPRQPGVLEQRARIHAELGEFPSALGDFTRCLELQPSGRVHLARAQILRQLGRVPEALLDFGRCLELEPENSMAFFERGQAHYDSGRVEEAIEDYAAAAGVAAKDEQRFLALARRAYVCRQAGRLEDALADYDRALALNLNPDLLLERGQTLADLGRPTEALADADRVLRMRPHDTEGSLLRGSMHFTLGHFEAAVADLDRALSSGEVPPRIAATVRARRDEAARLAATNR